MDIIANSMDTIPNAPDGATTILSSLARKQNSGGRLTFSEEGQAMVAATSMQARNFGPTIADMQPAPHILPEYVKGALAQFSA